MTVPDVMQLLAKIAAGDQRTVGDADILFWADVIPDSVELQDALTAVTKFHRESTRRIMPADVIRLARHARAERNGHRYYGDTL